MRKLATSPYDLARPDGSGRSTRRWIHLLFALCLALLLAPIAYEVGALCAANWKAMYGRIDHVETPILDRLGSTWSGMVAVMRQGLKVSYRQSLPWRPSLVIVLGFGWALFMGIPLRRSH